MRYVRPQRCSGCTALFANRSAHGNGSRRGICRDRWTTPPSSLRPVGAAEPPKAAMRCVRRTLIAAFGSAYTGFVSDRAVDNPRTLLERGLPANAMLHAKKMGWMYWPLRGQVRSHGIGDLSGKRITLWEGACSRLRYVRPQRCSGCTDLFANKFAPTGSVICPVNASRCGRELARDAVCPATERQRMYRPLREEVRAHGYKPRPSLTF